MPDAVHRLLMHGGLVIEEALLPIGALSEEALETCNKLLEDARRHHERLFDRTANNLDVMHMLLALSDPYLNSLIIEPKKKRLELRDEVKALLRVA